MENIIKIISNKQLILGLLILVAIVAPITATPYWMHIIIMVCIWSMAGIALNLIIGYTGQANLGLGAFFGLGAYTSALLMMRLGFNYWLALLCALVLAVAMALLIGIPALRTKGAYFAIATLCFNIIFTIIINHWDDLTEGNRGLMQIPNIPNIPLPWGGVIDFGESTLATYYVILIFLILTIIVFRRIVNSLMGRSFMAVRQDEDLSESIGINTFTTKLISFIVSGVIAALAGSLYTVYMGVLTPDMTTYNVTFNIMLYIIIGGLGTLAGPLVGAVILTAISEQMATLGAIRLVLFGLIIVVAIIYFPRGLVGAYRVYWLPFWQKLTRGKAHAA
jgi:branched-chain amino acid transport system permease protein